MAEAITTLGLTKRFKEKLTVNDLNMHVPKGSIYGFIKNGTMIKEKSTEELSRESKDYLNVLKNDPRKALSVVTEKMGLTAEMVGDEVHIFNYKDGGKVTMTLSSNGIVVNEITFHQLDLEEYFMKLTGGIER